VTTCFKITVTIWCNTDKSNQNGYRDAPSVYPLGYIGSKFSLIPISILYGVIPWEHVYTILSCVLLVLTVNRYIVWSNTDINRLGEQE